VIIGGAHPRDLQGQANTASVQEQLAEIFGHDPPFDLTLVVVTYGHNDHMAACPN
jgi:hypothetical protein